MHGQYFKLVTEQGQSPELSFSYLTSPTPTLNSETEGFITAVQDGVFHTLAYAKRVPEMPLGDTRCRACRTHEETVMHLLSACPRYAPTLYTDRHNMTLKVLYYRLRHEYKIDEQSIAPYQHHDSAATQQHSLEKKTYVIEMSCPADTNIADKEDEKMGKYKDLMYDFKNTYKEYETIFIPIIVGVMGGHNIAAYLGKIKIIKSKNIKGLINQMQKYVILASLRILRSHEASHSPIKGQTFRMLILARGSSRNKHGGSVIASCTGPYGPIHPQTGIIYWPNNSASEDGDVTDKRRFWGAAPVALLRSCVRAVLGRS
ncbi:hypothetical protein Trydic_g3761 [Trypoxylus dichotomus]